ncbi:hypothetical protein LEMLEM_LOCUS18398 [Lemmus lemmus]
MAIFLSHVFVSTDGKRLWFHSREIDIRFDWGRSLKILATDIKK